MQKYLLPAVLLNLALIGSSVAAPPAPEKAAQALDLLIEQLGDSDFRKRDEATRRLQLEGMKVVPALKKALGHPDAEVRRRVYDLIPRIEHTSFVAPRRVTLQMTNKPLRALFDEVTKQTGYKIEFWNAGDGRLYSWDFKEVTFWQALDRICRDADLVLQQNYGDERIILQRQGGWVPYVQHEGAFRFVPTGFQMYRQMDFGLIGNPESTPRRNETLTLTFQVFSEPRIPLLGVGEARLSAAYDNDRNSMLAPANNDGNQVMLWGGRMGRPFISRYGNGNRSYMQQTQLQLHRPSERASKVKVVRGELPVTLLVEQKPVVVAANVLKAKGTKNTAGTTTFHFEDVTVQPNKQYQVKLAITEDNRENPNDWTWMNTMLQRIELQDEKGNKFQAYGTSFGNSGPNQVQLTLTYGAPPNGKIGIPSKFVFQQWRTMQHLVPFEFKDLPLP